MLRPKEARVRSSRLEARQDGFLPHHDAVEKERCDAAPAGGSGANIPDGESDAALGVPGVFHNEVRKARGRAGGLRRRQAHENRDGRDQCDKNARSRAQA